MHSHWSHFVAIVLLAIAKGSAAYPSGIEESLQVTPRTEVSKEALMAVCPHTISRLATDEEVTGTWYSLEALGEHILNTSQRAIRTVDGCMKLNFTIIGDRLLLDIIALHGGVVNATETYIFTRGADKVWKGDLFDESSILGISTDSNLLVFCRMHERDMNSVFSALLGRNPETSEQQLQSTHGVPAATVSRFLYNIENCVTPTSTEPQSN